jgi:hypothetical protein
VQQLLRHLQVFLEEGAAIDVEQLRKEIVDAAHFSNTVMGRKLSSAQSTADGPRAPTRAGAAQINRCVKHKRSTGNLPAPLLPRFYFLFLPETFFRKVTCTYQPANSGNLLLCMIGAGNPVLVSSSRGHGLMVGRRADSVSPGGTRKTPARGADRMALSSRWRRGMRSSATLGPHVLPRLQYIASCRRGP